MTRSSNDQGLHVARLPQDFAPGVYRLLVGSGLLRANVYFIRADDLGRGATTPSGETAPSGGTAPSGESCDADAASVWVLVDTGVPGCDTEIRTAAEQLFGAGTKPAAILVTHAHPDHVGSAADLARHWQCPVYVHHQEVQMIGGDLSHFRRHTFTLDRWLILPLLRLAGRRHIQAIMQRGGLREFALPLTESNAEESEHHAHDSGPAIDGGALPVPGLPGWRAIHTPGHTPGHVALFRQRDRVLISGDAAVTRPEPFSALLGKRTAVSRSPWYFNWSQRQARDSLLKLADLEPSVVAGGHGSPRAGADLAAQLRALSAGR